ncbi:P-loop containing nucleoside triphosphate hydrolase protein [Mycena leptocephala]|nr:P-loop containing nucleoside triphosphate hydrolase protein [Mycena leptocephala]
MSITDGSNVVHLDKENVALVPSNSTSHGNSAVCTRFLAGPDPANLRFQIEDDAAQVLKNTILPIAVTGPTGTGKTTLTNLLSGSNLRVGKGLRSCTSTIQVAPVFELDGQSIMLIDTPGFDDTSRSDTEILTEIAAFLAKTYEQGTKLAGLIYMHRISDMRMGGISTRTIRMFRKLCGDDALKNVVIVTSMWGDSESEREVGAAREAELASDEEFFKLALDKGARLLRHYNNASSAQTILRSVIENQPRVLQIQDELVTQKKDLSRTAAGEELNREIGEQIKQHKEAMVKLQEELKEAIREKDEESKKELERETKKLQAEMTRLQNNSKEMVSDYYKQKAELERRMVEVAKVAEEARRDAERVEESHRFQVQKLEDRLHQSGTTTEAEKEDIKRLLSDLQRQYDEVRREQGQESAQRIGLFGDYRAYARLNLTFLGGVRTILIC